jgi:hypothetical protein
MGVKFDLYIFYKFFQIGQCACIAGRGKAIGFPDEYEMIVLKMKRPTKMPASR